MWGRHVQPDVASVGGHGRLCKPEAGQPLTEVGPDRHLRRSDIAGIAALRSQRQQRVRGGLLRRVPTTKNLLLLTVRGFDPGFDQVPRATSRPPSVVATVMVLGQRLEGCRTGRRWSGTRSMPGGGTRPAWAATTAAGGAGSRTPCWWTCGPGWTPRRIRSAIFRVSQEAASAAGLVGAHRVLDSTPLYDAVATMDTVTLIRSALRGLLRVADERAGGRAPCRAAKRRRLRRRSQAPDRLARCRGP